MKTLILTHDMARTVIGNIDYMKNRVPKQIFDPYAILLADKVQIHSHALSIHREFEEGEDQKFAVTLAADILKEAGVLEEVDPKIPVQQIESELSTYLIEIGSRVSSDGIITFTELDQENVLSNPIEALGLKDNCDNIPHVEFLAQTPDRIKEMILEDAYAKCFAGTGPDRIHDPIGTLARYSNMMMSENAASMAFSNNENVSDWFFDLVNLIMPDIDTILAQDGRAADAESPFSAHGFVPNNKDFVTADLRQTEMRVKLLLKLRRHDIFKNLRDEYASLLKLIQGGEGLALLPKRDELMRMWILARAELESELLVPTRLKKFNDIISIPAAIASFFLAPISAIPIGIWGTEKVLENKKRSAVTKKYPWLATAEVLGRAAVLSERELKKP